MVPFAFYKCGLEPKHDDRHNDDGVQVVDKERKYRKCSASKAEDRQAPEKNT